MLHGVEMLFGSEVNVLNGGKLDLDRRHLDCLDYAVAGIHGLCYENEGVVGNTDNVIRCMMDPKVRFISHPDDDRTPLDYELLCKGARDNGVALEVNNSSVKPPVFRLNSRQNYHVMLEKCEKYRVPVIINSDAHDPSAVGHFEYALAVIEETGFDQSLILNTDEKRLLDFLMNK